MASNPFHKVSYLDGVPFAINPVFLVNERENSSSSNNEDNFETMALNYDLNKSYSLLNTKIDYFTEANVLLKDKIKKQKKNLDNTKNLLITNNNYRNKSLSVSNIEAVYGNNTSNPSFSLPKPHKTEPSKSSAQPNFFNNTNSLLEPVRHLPIQSKNESNQKKTDDKNNNTNTVDNKNNFKDLFNYDSSSLDPFNDMELKTINDLEELKTILQNQQNQQISTQKEAQIQQQPTVIAAIQPVQQQQQPHSNLNSNINFKQTNSNFLVDNFGLPIVNFK
jgi:hypothetical protein